MERDNKAFFYNAYNWQTQLVLNARDTDFSFRHNFTKKYLFSKVRIIPDSARSDLSKEPIKRVYLCKSAKKKGFVMKTGPKRQVHYGSVKVF